MITERDADYIVASMRKNGNDAVVTEGFKILTSLTNFSTVLDSSMLIYYNQKRSIIYYIIILESLQRVAVKNGFYSTCIQISVDAIKTRLEISSQCEIILYACWVIKNLASHDCRGKKKHFMDKIELFSFCIFIIFF